MSWIHGLAAPSGQRGLPTLLSRSEPPRGRLKGRLAFGLPFPAGVVGVATVFLVTLAPTVLATTFSSRLEPWRPDSERVAVGVSASDAVVLATLGEIVDTLEAVDSTGTAFRSTSILVLSELEYLKGIPEQGPLRVRLPFFGPRPDALRRQFMLDGGRGLFYLVLTPAGWLLATNFAPKGGAVPIHRSDEARIGAMITLAASSQSLESVAQRATYVIIGTPMAPERCQATQGDEICVRVRVDSTVVGAPLKREVLIYCPKRPVSVGARAVYALSPPVNGVFEVIGFHAGIFPIGPTLARKHSVHVDSLLRRIRLSRLQPTRAKE